MGRKRGRPVTNGEYVQKKRYLSMKEKADLISLEGTNDPGLELVKMRIIERAEEALQARTDELMQAPYHDLIAMILEEANRVLKVESKNPKGAFTKALNTSHITLRSAAGVIAQRSVGTGDLANEDVARYTKSLRTDLEKEGREKEEWRRRSWSSDSPGLRRRLSSRLPPPHLRRERRAEGGL